jgi:hypothetical protein
MTLTELATKRDQEQECRNTLLRKIDLLSEVMADFKKQVSETEKNIVELDAEIKAQITTRSTQNVSKFDVEKTLTNAFEFYSSLGSVDIFMKDFAAVVTAARSVPTISPENILMLCAKLTRSHKPVYITYDSAMRNFDIGIETQNYKVCWDTGTIVGGRNG